jgi:hypothetical protein
MYDVVYTDQKDKRTESRRERAIQKVELIDQSIGYTIKYENIPSQNPNTAENTFLSV